MKPINRALFGLAALSAAGLTAGAISPPAHACEGPSTHVSDIYPTAETLPENLLRFYIYFSAPMGQGDILPSITLLDSNGEALEGVFLSNRYDLWSADRTRLTLLLDPGRVKTGLVANDAMGRALEAGLSYTLLVGATGTDATGCAVAEDRRTFTVGPPDIDPPAPGTWFLATPEAGTLDPLAVDLGGPHDHLSLVYRLRVLDAEGEVVPGHIALADGESVWTFTPASPWMDSSHRLVINEQLEDLAGNRPGVLFDQPMNNAVAQWAATLDWTPLSPAQASSSP